MSSEPPFAVGDIVLRVASDYTSNRVGQVVRVSDVAGRCQVAWLKESDGRPILPMRRTWCKYATLKKKV